MPKGKKVGSYVTLKNRSSMQFRKIAQIMTARGDRMNHATARGLLLKGLEKIVGEVLVEIKGYKDPVDVQRLIRDESFQAYVGEVLDDDEIIKHEA